VPDALALGIVRLVEWRHARSQAGGFGGRRILSAIDRTDKLLIVMEFDYLESDKAWRIDAQAKQGERSVAQQLTGGLSIDRFDAEIRERRFARFEGAFTAAEAAAVYDLRRFDAVQARALIPPHFIDIYSGGQLVKLAEVQNKSGQSGTSLIMAYLREGATIRVRELQMFDAGIAALMNEVQRLFQARSQINLYLTPPSTSGFPAHFDITDAFILQCSGAKSWTVFERYVDQQQLPLVETPWEPERYKPQDAGNTMTMRAGDVLYLPRGTMHGAACLSQASLHLTISLAPLTIADVMVREVKRYAEANVELRQRAVWARDGGAAALTAKIREHFQTLTEAAQGRDAVEVERRVLQSNDEIPADALTSCLAELEAKKPSRS
jgi:hypothetical protein